jgi:hypothetical protein
MQSGRFHFIHAWGWLEEGTLPVKANSFLFETRGDGPPLDRPINATHRLNERNACVEIPRSETGYRIQRVRTEKCALSEHVEISGGPVLANGVSPKGRASPV